MWKKEIPSLPNIQKSSYFHIFFWEISFIFRLNTKIIFSIKNAIFPDNTRNIIFQCNVLERRSFPKIWKKKISFPLQCKNTKAASLTLFYCHNGSIKKSFLNNIFPWRPSFVVTFIYFALDNRDFIVQIFFDRDIFFCCVICNFHCKMIL